MAPVRAETEATLSDGGLRHEAPPRRAGRVDELAQQLDRLRERIRIAVVYGGDKASDGAVINKTANPRSWKSYQDVAEDIAQALSRLGFRHVRLLPDDMRLGDRLRDQQIHLAWLNSGGVQGYNPMAHTAAMLEMFGVPYIGHDPLTAGTLDNKDAFKRNLLHLGIRTPPFMTWHVSRGAFRPKVNSQFLRTFKEHWGAYVVKPVSGRASIHIHVVDDESDLSDAIDEVIRATENHVLIEAHLPGREFCVAVSGAVVAQDGELRRRCEPFVFSEMELMLDPGERIATSIDLRPITADRLRILEADGDGDTLRQLHELARKVYLEMNLASIVRLDVRADAAGALNVLEANPKPDLKAPGGARTSLVSAGLDRHGMTYDDLILSLLADRIDFLFSQRRGTVNQLGELLA